MPRVAQGLRTPSDSVIDRSPVRTRTIVWHELTSFLDMLFYYLDVVSDVITVIIIFPISRSIAGLLIALMLFRVVAQFFYNMSIPSIDNGLFKNIRTLTDLDFAWEYLRAPWSTTNRQTAIIFVQSIFESGPTFVVQMALFIYFQFSPTGFDAVAFFLLSTALSLLECFEKYYGFSSRHVIPSFRLAVFTIVDVFANCMTHVLFAFKISTLLVHPLGESLADEALVTAVIITVFGWFLLQFMQSVYLLRTNDSFGAEESRFVECFGLIFSSIPIYSETNSKQLLLRIAGVLAYPLVIGALYVQDSTSRTFEVATGAAIIACGITRCLLVPLLQWKEDSSDKKEAAAPIWGQDSGLSRFLTKALRFALTLLGLGIAISLGFLQNFVLSSNVSDLNCNSLARAQLPGLLGVNSLTNLNLQSGCQPCVISSVQTITNINLLQATLAGNVYFSSTAVAFQGSSTCPWVAQVQNVHFESLQSTSGSLGFVSVPLVTTLSLPLLSFAGGSLEFASNAALTYVDMSQLTFTGGLAVFNDTALVGLKLAVLQHVQGDFRLSNVPLIATVNTASIVSIGGSIIVDSNPLLSQLNLPLLSYVGTGLIIQSNSVMIALVTPQITFIGVAVTFDSNMALTSLSLPQIQALQLSMTITSNAQLAELDPLVLTYVGMDVEVSMNGRISSLSFANLTFVGGSVKITSNQNLSSVNFDVVSVALGSVTIDNNILLPSLRFPALNSTSSFQISLNTAVTVVQAPQLSYVRNTFNMYSNAVLTFVDISKLNYVGGFFYVYANPSLSSVMLSFDHHLVHGIYQYGTMTLNYLGSTGLQLNSSTIVTTLSLAQLSVVTSFVDIFNNSVLTEIDFPMLTFVSSDLQLYTNNALLYVNISQLTYIGGLYQMNNNPVLATMDLSQLVHVGGNIVVTANNNLLNLPLSHLNTVGGLVNIHSLTMLSALYLSSLTYASGIIELYLMPQLTFIDFSSLSKVGSAGIEIYDNYATTAILLPMITSAGHLDIDGQSLLLSLNMSLFASTTTDMIIAYNYVMTSLDLSQLSYVGGLFQVMSNPVLSYFYTVQLRTVAYRFEVYSNAVMTGFDFTHLTFVNDHLYFYSEPSVTLIDFAQLTFVRGPMTIKNNGKMTTLNLPSLAVANNDMSIKTNNALTVVNVPVLTYSFGGLYIDSNTQITYFSLPLLRYMRSDLEFFDLLSLTAVNVPMLTFAGSFRVSYCPNMTVIGQSVLTYVSGDFEISDDTALTYISFSALGHIGSGLYYLGNQLLTTALQPMMSFSEYVQVQSVGLLIFSLPHLTWVDNEFNIVSNTLLTFVDFPLLTYVRYDITINNNNVLTILSVPLLTHLGTFAFQPYICANGPTFVIPPFLGNYTGNCVQGDGACKYLYAPCK